MLYEFIKKYKIDIIFLFVLFNLLCFHVLIGLTYNNIDLFDFNIPWAQDVAKYGLKCYSFSNIDYPPLFPMLLGIFGNLINQNLLIDKMSKVMLFVKMIPIIFNMLTTVSVYLILRNKIIKSKAFFYSFIWALNITLALNSSWWGQADCLLVFFILIMFYFLEQKKLVISSIFFALGCLTKLQMLYFFPFLLIYAIVKFDYKTIFKAFLSGLFIGVIGWLPFMISNNSISLPFEIYFGGYDKYPFVNMYGANFWGLFKSLNLRYINDCFSVFNFTFAELNTVIWFVIAIIYILIMYMVKKYKIIINVYALGLIYFGLIVMFTMKQHERYLIPMLLFLFMWAIDEKVNINRLILYNVLNISLFMQTFLMFIDSIHYYDWMLVVFSFINIIVFLLCVIDFIKSELFVKIRS